MLHEWLASNLLPDEDIDACEIHLRPSGGDSLSATAAPGYRVVLVNPQDTDYLVLGWVDHRWWPREAWVIFDHAGERINNDGYTSMMDAVDVLCHTLHTGLQDCDRVVSHGARICNA
jgi:hypothetical protein